LISRSYFLGTSHYYKWKDYSDSTAEVLLQRNSGRFVKQEQWERWQFTKNKFENSE